MQKIVIGLNGIARSGKDTSAKFMKEFFEEKGLKVDSFYFAKRLKDVVDYIFLLDSRHRDGELKESVAAFHTDEISIKLAFSSMLLHDFYPNLEERDVVVDSLYKRFIEVILNEAIHFTKAGTKITVVTSPRRLYQVFGTDIVREGLMDNFWTEVVKKEILKSDADVIFVTDVRFDNECEMLKYDFNPRSFDVKIVKVERPSLVNKVASHKSEKGISQHFVDTTLVNDSTLENLELASTTLAGLLL